MTHTQRFCCALPFVILSCFDAFEAHVIPYTAFLERIAMNTTKTLVRKTWAVSLIALGLTAASLTQADTPRQFAGPRNTIPPMQRTQVERTDASTATLRRFGPRNTIPAEQSQTTSAPLQATTDGRQLCKASRIAHYGHPGKGIDRIETVNVPCGRSRYAERKTRG